jgi:hypothetical protein
VHAFDDRRVDPIPLQFVMNVDALDDQNLVLKLDLTTRLTDEPAIACVYLARLQRAPEGSCQSTAGGGDNIVERGGIGRGVPRVNPVVLCHLRMDSKCNRTLPYGEEGLPDWTLVSYNLHLRGVNDVTHDAPPLRWGDVFMYVPLPILSGS